MLFDALRLLGVSLVLPLLILDGLFVSYNWLVFACWLWFLKSAEMGFPLPPVTYYFVCSLFFWEGGDGEKEEEKSIWSGAFSLYDLMMITGHHWTKRAANWDVLAVGYHCVCFFYNKLRPESGLLKQGAWINPVSAEADEFLPNCYF